MALVNKLVALKSSKFGRNVRLVAKKLLPPGTRRNRLVVKTKVKILEHLASRPAANYKEWVDRIELAHILRPAKHKLAPTITIVSPVYNTPDKYLVPMVESVINQTYQNWLLYLVQGGCSSERKAAIHKLAKRDKRIRVIDLPKNLGISGNTNAGLKQAKSEYTAFMDSDDALPEWTLNEVVAAINRHPMTDIFYSDEDYLSDDGKNRVNPYFKPDWSPELFFGVNYVTHFVVVRTSLMNKIGLLKKRYDGSQDFDFFIRAWEAGAKIRHIPKILYHWRMAEGSTARTSAAKSYPDAAGRRALEDYFKRHKIDAKVIPQPERPTNYRVKYATPGNPKVSIIIPHKDNVEMTRRMVESVLNKTAYKNYEILLINNNSEEPATLEYIKEIKKHPKVRTLDYPKKYNHSAINNFGRRQARGGYIFALNNDMEIINPEWLEEMLGVAMQPGIGAVGALLLYPDETIQHAGIIVGLTGMSGHIFRKMRPGERTPNGINDWPRNFLAVTAACLAIKAETLDKVGGFPEEFIIAGNDVALGIKLYEAGYRNVFWPQAKLYHYESYTLGGYSHAPKSDHVNSMKFYRQYHRNGDPYYNPNLDLQNEQPAIKGRP